MKGTSLYKETVSQNHFKIDYPYYGLFGSATITPMYDGDEVIYRCRLLNGSTILLKKQLNSKKWVDTTLEAETPLATIIGLSIDDFLKIKKGA